MLAIVLHAIGICGLLDDYTTCLMVGRHSTASKVVALTLHSIALLHCLDSISSFFKELPGIQIGIGGQSLPVQGHGNRLFFRCRARGRPGG